MYFDQIFPYKKDNLIPRLKGSVFIWLSILLFLNVLPAIAQDYEGLNARWTGFANGVNGEISAMVTDGENIFVGGNSTWAAGNVPINGVARYNLLTDEWSSLKIDLSGVVRALFLDGEYLYISGQLRNYGVVRYNLNTDEWETLATDDSNSMNIYSIIVHENTLFVGGSFEEINGQPITGIAQYDLQTQEWSSVIEITDNVRVNDLEIFDGDLYIGGVFNEVEDERTQGLVRYNLESKEWTGFYNDELTVNINQVWDFTFYQGELYIVGSFIHSYGEDYVAKYNATEGSWDVILNISEDINAANEEYTSIIVDGDYVYLSGNFSFKLGNSDISDIAKIDLATGELGYLAEDESFNEYNAYGAGGPGNAPITSLLMINDVLYMGGEFHRWRTGETDFRGYNYVGNVYGFNTQSKNWKVLGEKYDGIRDGRVNTMYDDGDALYIGGYFTKAGKEDVDHVTKFDKATKTFSKLDLNLHSETAKDGISGIVKIENELYLAGSITKADGWDVGGIIKYNLDTDTWSDLNGGVNTEDNYRRIYAMVEHEGKVYIGGHFQEAGNSQVKNIAVYDTTTGEWSSLGLGVTEEDGTGGAVYALYVHENNLYVGGKFTMAGGNSAKSFAKYDLNTGGWSSLDDFEYDQNSNVDASIHDVKVHNNYIYVAGVFTHVNGMEAWSLVRYNMDSEEWETLVAENTQGVQSITFQGSYLYAGGGFYELNGIKYATGIARYHLTEQEWSIVGANTTDGRTLDGVRSLQGDNEYIYAAGGFYRAANRHSNKFALWEHESGTGDSNGDNYPEEVTVTAEVGFGEAESPQDYRLIALPGAIDEQMSALMEGTHEVNWQAYWDDGFEEDYLVKYDGSEAFTFEPGNGFWVTSTESFEYSETLSTVELDAENHATIPLHDGWNIISNPLDIDVSWSDISSANGGNIQPIWGFDGAFDEGANFESAKTGHAYYFLNDQQLEGLRIPYSTVEAKSKSDNHDQVISLKTSVDGEVTSTTKVQFVESENDKNPDVVAPPGGFEQASLRFSADKDNKNYERAISHARIYRLFDSAGRKFEMQLTAEPEKPVTISMEGWNTQLTNQVVLLDKNTGSEYDLTAPEDVAFMPGEEKTEFLLVMGDANYVEQQRDEFLPNQVNVNPNYPNPFNPTTTIQFALPEQTEVRVQVYDVIGRRVSTLVDEVKDAGVHKVRFDASRQASGMYFAVFEIGKQRFIQKMTLIK